MTSLQVDKKDYGYIVTTYAESLPKDRQVIMVDGTVPGWAPAKGDLHFDHHRENGPAVQLLDLVPEKIDGNVSLQACFATTQVDADAIVAAAYVQLLADNSYKPSWWFVSYRKFLAIAYDCDHLGVPPELSDLADFAAQVVAALKSTGMALAATLGLPENRQSWTAAQKEEYASLAFKQGTEWLVDSFYGLKPWPGESGEAVEYWNQLELDVKEICNTKQLASLYSGCLVFNGIKLKGRYIDPRAWLKAAKQLDLTSRTGITLTQRLRLDNGQANGYSYTLGVVPCHANVMDNSINYVRDKTYEALTTAERIKNPLFQGWGGRETVGGSSWNTGSSLEYEEVLNIVLDTCTRVWKGL